MRDIGMFYRLSDRCYALPKMVSFKTAEAISGGSETLF
jgi:hypothetical protein